MQKTVVVETYHIDYTLPLLILGLALLALLVAGLVILLLRSRRDRG